MTLNKNNNQILRGVMAKWLDCGLKVSEFEFQSFHYVLFCTNTLWKDKNSLPHHPCYELNTTATVLLQG